MWSPHVSVTLILTIPHTTIELHPEANTHHPVSQGVKPNHAGDNWGAEVFQHNIIGVLIT